MKLKTRFIFLILSSFTLSSYANTEMMQTLLSGSNIINIDNVYSHLKKLQEISDQNSGNRASSLPGHELSANYIAQKLLAAGYDVKFSPYTYTKYEKTGPAILRNLTNENEVYEEETHFQVMPYSPSGSISGAIEGVDLSLGLGNSSTSGCEIDDFKSFTKGNIALIQRGECTFVTKALNAQNAGASAVIIFNQGNDETRKELFGGTLGEKSTVKISVLSATYDLGEKLSKVSQENLQIITETSITNAISYNVIAETKNGNPNNIVMLGSHLDGVTEGPGINDNGSGSSAILEVALTMSKMNLNNKVRFAWWGSEELGLIGSREYVAALSEKDKEDIALYLNFDMIASPNYMIGIFDGNASLTEYKAPKGSYAIESLFQHYFDINGQNHIEIESSGRSDYAAFAEVGIPYGGLFTGAEGLMTKEEALLFNGTEGQPYDSCYHKECDNIDNINLDALEINSNAIAFMALSFSHSTAAIDAEINAPDLPITRVARTDGGYIPSDIGHDLHSLEIK